MPGYGRGEVHDTRIDTGIEALGGLPVLYIKELDAIVCSDLHLGYEGTMAGRGAFLPKANLRHVKEALRKAARKTRASVMIINGDVKNEFSAVGAEELNEFVELYGFVTKELGIGRVVVVKGNHDNFINRITGRYGIEMHEQEYALGGFLFFHGEEIPKGKSRFLVMGHLHPAVTLYDDAGFREKMRCFLYGRMRDGRKLLVLPAISYFAEGVSVNLEDASGIAPVFKNLADIDNMKAMCIGEGETLGFGTVRDLRRAGVG